MVDRGASGETELNGWWVPDCARLAGAPLPEDGGVLRVCLDLAGVERPRTFEAPSGNGRC